MVSALVSALGAPAPRRASAPPARARLPSRPRGSRRSTRLPRLPRRVRGGLRFGRVQPPPRPQARQIRRPRRRGRSRGARLRAAATRSRTVPRASMHPIDGVLSFFAGRPRMCRHPKRHHRTTLLLRDPDELRGSIYTTPTRAHQTRSRPTPATIDDVLSSFAGRSRVSRLPKRHHRATSPNAPRQHTHSAHTGQSVTHRLTDSPTHRLTDSPTHRLTDSPTHRGAENLLSHLVAREAQIAVPTLNLFGHAGTKCTSFHTKRIQNPPIHLTDSPTHRLTDTDEPRIY